MHLLLIGINHRTAPVELRERLDFQTRGLDRALRLLASRQSIRESVVLSTCNRAEMYAACDDAGGARSELVDFFCEFHEVDSRTVVQHLYDKVDGDVVRHLFRVAAGLDSMVVGEPQILGQVKDAFTRAGELGVTGPVLTRLFHSSFAVGKRVRTETALGSGAVSVGYAAVSLAKKIFGDLAGRSVLVVGAGEMGKLTALHLKSQGVRRIVIMSRSMAHAARTAEMIGGATAAPWDQLDSSLATSDIVITATSAASFVLTAPSLEAIMRARRDRPLFIIDIGLPRDVDPAAGEIEQVFLYNIDDLQAAVRESLARRADEATRAELIVAEEAEKFDVWFRSRGAIPVVIALRQRFESIRHAELERLDFKLSALTPEARARVDEVTHLLVEKLLATPTERLKTLGDAQTVSACTEALVRLFGLSNVPEPDERAGGKNRVEPFAPAKTRYQR